MMPWNGCSRSRGTGAQHPWNAHFTIQIIKRSDAAVGFEVIPRRWVVERTFAWMTRWRRLVRDYEERIDCSEA